MPRPVVAISLPFLVAALTALPASAQAPEERFAERAFVTAIDVVAEVRDARGETPADLKPSDFRLLENGIEQRIIGVEYLTAAPNAPAAPAAPASPRPATPRSDWQIVVWFDAMTMSRTTLGVSVQELTRRVPDLLKFGTVTVVYADLVPEMLIEGTRDPSSLASAIETIRKRPPGDRLAKVRREFLTAGDNVTTMTIPGSEEAIIAGAPDRFIPSFVAEEERLLGIARRNLIQWVGRMPRKTPRMLVYVGDGFDLDPAEFYIQTLQASGDATVDPQQLRSEIQTRTRTEMAAFAKELALGGWTVLAIGGTPTHFADDVTRSSGRRFSGTQTGSAPPFIFLNPGDPLIQLAEETGGERIGSAAALPTALADLGRRIRITYQVDREPDPLPRRIEIVPLRAGLTVRATEWATSTTTDAVAAARALEILSGGGPQADLNVTVSLRRDSDPPSIEARIDFAPLAAAAAQIGATKLRMTIAVDIEGSPAEIIHRIIEIVDLGTQAGLIWTAPIKLPEKAGAIAIVAEELTTGSWGGARINAGALASAPPENLPLAGASAPPTLPAATRAEALARAVAERKLILAFEWDPGCRGCVQIETTASTHPELARRLGAFIVLPPAAAGAGEKPRVALYDPSGELFLSWPVVDEQNSYLSAGDLTSLLQQAAAAAPHLLRAHDFRAKGETIDERLAVAFAYQDAAEPARAEKAYAEAERAARERGNASKAQTARVLGSLMAANQRRVDEATRTLREVIAAPVTPLNEAEAHLIMAFILRAQGKEKEAAAELDRTLQLAPENSAAYQAARAMTGGGSGQAALASPDTAAARPLQLVVSGKAPYSGRTRLQVIVRDPAVRSVGFRVDDGKEIVDAKPPFETTVDLGATPRRREVRAVARRADGRAAGEDAMVLNERHDEFWVRLRRVERSSMLRAETNVPVGTRVEALEFFVDGAPAQPLPSDSAAIRLPEKDDPVVVRAVARLNDGRTAEDAQLVGGTGYAETIEARDVEIYAAVLDASGTPIANLDRSQFTIEEGGRRKRVAAFEFLGRAPVAVGLAIDSSSSMRDVMPDVHRSARAFLDLAVKDGSSAFIVDFDSAPHLVMPRTTNLPILNAAVSNLKADGSTALYDAMIFGLLQLQGVPGKRALIVLTDGRDETSRYGLKDAIAVARESGVAIYAIVLAPPPRLHPSPPGAIYGMRSTARSGPDPALETIAIESGGRAWYLPESANMDTIYRAIDAELRNQYRLTYRTAPGANDWREHKVSVDVPGATVRAAAGFVAR